MSILDELKSLDANDVGRWPLVFRLAVIVIVFAAVTVNGPAFTNHSLVNVEAAGGCVLCDDDLSIAIIKRKAAGRRKRY
jgi:hypothetical protein